jgi:hypothetical protein
LDHEKGDVSVLDSGQTLARGWECESVFDLWEQTSGHEKGDVSVLESEPVTLVLDWECESVLE